MSGDYSRHTFRPDRHFSGVRLQQGRVSTDADWNEAVDIAHHRKRRALADVIGPTGMPEDAPGFALTPVVAAGVQDLAVGHGRAYLGGLLVEHLPASPVTLEAVSGNGADTVWRLAVGPRLAQGQWLGPPDNPLSDPVPVAELLADGQGGHQRLKLARDMGAGPLELVPFATLAAQPQLPDAAIPEDPGPYLAYLDVWEREITALEDAYIVEVALGGPDTALRSQVVWQVKLAALQPLIDDGTIQDPPVCKAFGPDWRPDGGAVPARLAARTEPSDPEANPCVLPSQGGYRSLQNRLYRIQAQTGGVPGQDPVFVKWSRDNGIHRSRLLGVVDGSLEVDSAGRDEATALRPGDWVEVLDEGRILRGEAGFFVELGEVVDTRLGVQTLLDPVTLQPLIQNSEPDVGVLPGRGLVRRWEGGSPVEMQPDQWLELEDGVQIKLDAGRAAVGHYWLIAARTLSADVEWPLDEGSGEPLPQPPLGVEHRYCPLAVVNLAADGSWTVADDCRPLFPPLTGLVTFFYLGGDGQEAMPDLQGADPGPLVSLDSPLQVGVARGGNPLAGRLVRFRITDPVPHGQLTPGPGVPAERVIRNTGTELVLLSGEDGTAAAGLSLDRRRHGHHVLAELLDASDPDQADRAHLPIRFRASTSVAAQVAYDPDGCAYQAEVDIAPGTALTVQQALDKLCPRLELVLLGGDGQELCVGERAPVPLQVGLFWGRQGLAGMKVAFEVVRGDAAMQPPEAATDAGGVATADLVAGADSLADGGRVLVRVKVVDAPVPTSPEVLSFAARFVNARCVYLDREICPEGQEAAGDNTLAGLLEQFCRSQQPGMHVVGVFQQGNDRALGLDQVVEVQGLLRGLRFDLDMELDPAALKSELPGVDSRPVGEVKLELPFPVTGDEREFWAGERFGYQPTLLEGSFELARDSQGRDNHAILWLPSDRAKEWLNNVMNVLERLGSNHIEARVRLYGNRIWSLKDRRFHLDGELFADPSASTGLRFPSGDGVAGGDLVLPFYIGRPN